MNRKRHTKTDFKQCLGGKKVLPRTAAVSDYKKRTSQNVAVQEGEFEGDSIARKEIRI